jgi:demethylmenaquinone methyltransferase/2-methoxy-6-polyprenyl-1,4-benzoquinol methylase
MDKREFFDSMAADWPGHPEPQDAPAKRAQFVALATEGSPSRILDVGCGTGILVPDILMQCPSSTIVELDFAPEMIARNQAKHSQPNVLFVCSSIEGAPLDPESFDAVVCFNVMPHLDSLNACLRKLVQLLRLGGRLSVGHLMGSAEVNAFHAGAGGPVQRDHLPPVEKLASLLRLLHLRVQIAEERPDWYFLRAERPVK